MTSKTDLAWAAGFIDGEGCISIARQNSKTCRSGHRYTMKLVVSQKRRPALDKLQAMFGGTVKKPSSQDIWWWVVTAQQAKLALEAVFPYLVEKYDQAEVAIAFQGRRVHGNQQADGHAQTDNDDYTLISQLKRAA